MPGWNFWKQTHYELSLRELTHTHLTSITFMRYWFLNNWPPCSKAVILPQLERFPFASWLFFLWVHSVLFQRRQQVCTPVIILTFWPENEADGYRDEYGPHTSAVAPHGQMVYAGLCPLTIFHTKSRRTSLHPILTSLLLVNENLWLEYGPANLKTQSWPTILNSD